MVTKKGQTVGAANCNPSAPRYDVAQGRLLHLVVAQRPARPVAEASPGNTVAFVTVARGAMAMAVAEGGLCGKCWLFRIESYRNLG